LTNPETCGVLSTSGVDPDLIRDVLFTRSHDFMKGPTMQAAKLGLGESLLMEGSLAAVLPKEERSFVVGPGNRHPFGPVQEHGDRASVRADLAVSADLEHIGDRRVPHRLDAGVDVHEVAEAQDAAVVGRDVHPWQPPVDPGRQSDGLEQRDLGRLEEPERDREMVVA
jgi:hypothetical protein